MSVALLSEREIGAFLAAVKTTHNDRVDEKFVRRTALTVAAANRAAYAASYGVDSLERDNPEGFDLDAAMAAFREIVASPSDLAGEHWGPVTYNMIAQDGRTYLAASEVANNPAATLAFEALQAMEETAHAFCQQQTRELARAEANAVAYNEVGQLPTMEGDEIAERCRAAGCERIIVARFMVNESDSMTDYFGGRQAREVVIGFAKGKRENFRQLRKAAGGFAPTAEFGPGRDEWTARVVLAEDAPGGGGCGAWKGSYSHWHDDISGAEFATKAEAEDYIAEKGEPYSVGMSGATVRFEWSLSCKSFEQRENYSMGGGNYLGRSRYSGWKVTSFAADCLRGQGRHEVHNV